jgi:hypothetical protein
MMSCGGSPPAPPSVGTPSGSQTINGTERIGWDQAAADAVELATIGYVIYVDGARTPLADVTCGSTPAAVGFPCTARLPAMSTGAHALELASIADNGAGPESARSSALQVTVVTQTASAKSAAVLRDDVALGASVVADGVDSPTDLAFAADGRIFVAERAGSIRVIRDGRLLSEPAVSLADAIGANGQLLAIALDPGFDRTHHLFAIYTALGRSGVPAFTLARFREVSDTLGDRAVLLEGVAASSPSPAAALRFGPDGKLYAAFDDGGNARRRQDAGSLNGKVLRLNTDGTTPADARGATPVYADGYGAPVALDWDPPTATLWVADRSAGSAPFAFYRGALMPSWTGRLVSAESLFVGGPSSGVSVVAVGPDGAIYYGTASAIGRLVPNRAP